ncbi:hypothetical protein M427DRAFT_157745 [Gonapodya prolifera JEL478]|uniref:Uncharacterized protein n=1 Tax=Gonapodya prolifera (strain JEL478) TaxID=1344416 RepID=A0A139A529_GONPJ|nr:hypothetical protein M427DRAFT_157745 [Gonapodya prolifera JEL478]|eukprot:KXS11917.1 hypothetical protein M427DRAFT_157745 [Gonapodya prolifera JEL478]
MELSHVDGVRWYFRPSSPLVFPNLSSGLTARWRCWLVPRQSLWLPLSLDSSSSSTDLRGGRQVAESDIRTSIVVDDDLANAPPPLGGAGAVGGANMCLWRYPADTSFLLKIKVDPSPSHTHTQTQPNTWDLEVEGLVCTPGFLFADDHYSPLGGSTSTSSSHAYTQRSSPSGTPILSSLSIPSPTHPHRFQQPLYPSSLASYVLHTAQMTIPGLDTTHLLADDAVVVWLARAALGDRDDGALPSIVAHYAWTRELLAVSRDVLGQLMERHRYSADWAGVAPAQAVAALLEQNYGYRRRLYSALRRVRFLVDGRSWVGDDVGSEAAKAECRYPASTILVGRALVADMKRRSAGLMAVRPYLAGELAGVVEEIVNKVALMTA